MVSLLLCLAGLLSFCALGVQAAPESMLSAAPANLVSNGQWVFQTPSPDDAVLDTPSAGVTDRYGRVYRITVHTAVDPYYQIQLTQSISSAVPDGDRVRLHFWGRSSTSNPLRAVVEQSQPPYTRALDSEVRLTPEWKEYVVTASVPSYGPDGLGVRFQVGEKAGKIELASIILQDVGPDPAISQARTAIQPTAVQARIRRFRMADLTVIVHDAHGKPVHNASVSVKQTRHAFLFGCNIFALNPDDHSQQQIAYQNHFAALFNYATLPFYWGAFEGTQGKPDYPRLDSMTRWCIGHGITPKGHPLVWHEVYPSWAPRDADAAIPLLHARVTDIVAHYKGLIGYWDVVNEANSPDPKTGEGAWIERDGAANVVGTALSWARAAGQGTSETFLYNDYNTSDSNLTLLAQLQKQGRLPDAIGLQSHMHSGPWKLTDVWARSEAFSRFGRPIHFTETTVVSGPAPGPIDMNKHYDGWVTTPEGEAAQADYVARFYTVLFSHPSVRAITWWDLSDHDAWLGAPAGLLRKDMTPKPAYDRLLTLIHKTWWTDIAGKSNTKGRYAVHAFYGDYQITVTDRHGHTRQQTLTMPEGSGPHQVVLRLS